jgi:Tol biopolymer transport system component
VVALDRTERARLMLAEQHAMYAPPGYLLHVSRGTLLAQRFDPARMVLSGQPISVAQGVGQNDGFQHSGFDISPAGILAHRNGGATLRRQLVWADRTGKVLGTVGPADEMNPTSPALSPDNRHVANGRITQANPDVWLTDVTTGVPTRFTFNSAPDFSPMWSPDGTRIVFRSSRNGPSDLFIKPANGAADEQPFLITPLNKTPLDWSADGRFVLYAVLDPKTQSDLWALPVAGPSAAAEMRKPFPVVQTTFDETQGQFSPDGRWIVYTSNESGREEIYVRPFPETGGKWQVSSAGGSQPRWRPDGRELFYVSADGHMMAVAIHTTPDGRAVEAGRPVALFAAPLAAGSAITLSGWQSRALYAVARDGRFLMNVNLDTEGADLSPLTIVLNWDAELKK